MLSLIESSHREEERNFTIWLHMKKGIFKTHRLNGSLFICDCIHICSECECTRGRKCGI